MSALVQLLPCPSYFDLVSLTFINRLCITRASLPKLYFAPLRTMIAGLDNQFGPQLAGHFDFTLLFEQTIFEVAPNSLLILATPFYGRSIIVHAAQQVPAGPLLWAKLATGALLVVTYVSKAALWQTASELQSHWSIVSSVMSLLGSLCTLLVLYSAHTYNKALSTFVSLFFSLTLLLDIALARSYFLRHDMGFSSMHPIAGIQTVGVVLKLLLVVLEEVPKTTHAVKRQTSSSVKCDSELGFWGKAMFFSVNSLLLFGYKNELTIENLPALDEQFGSRRLFDRFYRNWNRGKHNEVVKL